MRALHAARQNEGVYGQLVQQMHSMDERMHFKCFHMSPYVIRHPLCRLSLFWMATITVLWWPIGHHHNQQMTSMMGPLPFQVCWPEVAPAQRMIVRWHRALLLLQVYPQLDMGAWGPLAAMAKHKKKANYVIQVFSQHFNSKSLAMLNTQNVNL